MSKIKLVVFDLAGTTVEDDKAVAGCLHKAALEFGLHVDLDDFQKTIGTNKIHLYQYMIARDRGQDVSFADLEKNDFPELYAEAHQIFERYSVIMLDHYRNEVKPMPGAEDVFRWCRAQGIRVATDTGFHNDVNKTIMAGLKWLENGLVDLAVDVEDTDGVGRPAPYMIFYAMQHFGIQSVHEVIKIGDTPADLLSGYNAGCIGNIGVLSGANSAETLGQYRHTHLLTDVTALPALIERDFS